jgi:starch synthase
MYKVLFLTSEVYPLIKTGGLADVSASLPAALAARGHEVRILLPGYEDAMVAAGELEAVASVQQRDGEVTLLQGVLPNTAIKIWLVSHKGYFNRAGNPYLLPDGQPWPDNDERFALFARVAVDIAMDRAGLAWKPDIVHGNDWQSGLAPALLDEEEARPATVFTVHNLAYQGLFPFTSFTRLSLPKQFWSYRALEFHGQLSFIKGGLVYADRINTVSPTYAHEIQGDEFGCGLQGLLSLRRSRLSGILNGIDTEQWNPATDRRIAKTYDTQSLSDKQVNKLALQKYFRLPEQAATPVIAFIGRLVDQKGVDLILQSLPELSQLPLQLLFLGNGNNDHERDLMDWADRHPYQIAIKAGYDESLAHLIEAGADMFLMPSRFEPCGLNQMYSQRYGTVPIVRSIGGLADTVEDASPTRLTLGTASGVVFQEASAPALSRAINRALKLYPNKAVWRKLQLAGMAKDFSWHKSADQYVQLYESALADRAGRQ